MIQRRRVRRRNKRRTRDITPQYKLCVRLLPPNLTEKEFLNTLHTNDVKVAHNSYYYVQGHYSSKKFKRQTHSRAYLHFDSTEELNKVSRLIERCKFTDDLGNATIPTLQLSPFVKKINDDEKNTLQGTISKDHIFQTFVKSWRILGEDKTNTLKFKDISVITPLKKELDRQASIELALKLRKERALSELAGDVKNTDEKQKKKKRKKRKKRKSTKIDKPNESKKSNDTKDNITDKINAQNSTPRETRRQRRRKYNITKNNNQSQNENKSDVPKKQNVIKIKQRQKKNESKETTNPSNHQTTTKPTHNNKPKPSISPLKKKNSSRRRRSKKPSPKNHPTTSSTNQLTV